MYQPFTLFAAARYMRSKRRNRFASFVSIVSIAGIALGVAALVVVLSVMNGFEREVTRHVLSMTAHAVIVQQGSAISDWEAIDGRIRQDPRVVATSPYVRASGMLSHKGKVKGAVVEGIVPAREIRVTDLENYLSAAEIGALSSGPGRVLLGTSLARNLGAQTGDTVTLLVPAWDGSGNAVAPRYDRLTVAGIFHVGMHQFDSALMLASLDEAQRIFRMGDAVSGVRLRFEHASIAPEAARMIVLSLGPEFLAIDWTQYHQNFFLALESQKRIMFVILILIIAVAAFNIAANMIMVVTEKIPDIAILRTMGAGRFDILILFLLQGLILGAAGVVLGAILGALGAVESNSVAMFIEAALDVDLINSDVYFIDYLPADLHFGDIAMVAIASLFLSVTATIYPAIRAASIDPARAIHYD